MIQGLEITCQKYPHIEERLNKLKFDIQKSNYLSSLITEDRIVKDRRQGFNAERRGRKGFDPRATAEMFRYLESLGISGHQVDHGFTFSAA